MGFAENIGWTLWLMVIGSSLLLIFLSPKAKTITRFFQANEKGKEPSFWLLTSSLVISWIFAKSITNAANLGLAYGILGGIAYATYYLSFLVAGLVIFQMRVKGGYQSIHEFLRSKFGSTAVVLFSILIGFRLFNEVWSNTMVIGNYFGEQGSTTYYLSVLLFTALTLIYSLKGGLSSSMFTDAIQMILFAVLLIGILSIIGSELDATVLSVNWKFDAGLDLLLVALIQSLSYPFHDPVMTDRAFITEPRKMKRAFIVAVPIGFLSIVLFSIIGVYAKQLGMVGDATVQVANSMGIVMMLLINFIMITSASSTLDSAFSSFSKLSVIDLKLVPVSVKSGRLMMILMTIAGTIPIFFSPEILSATTVSGTMVIGFAPIFLFWNQPVPRQTFTWVVGTGLLFGIAYAIGLVPTQLQWTNSKYGSLLGINLVGTACCFLIFGMCYFFNRTRDGKLAK